VTHYLADNPECQGVKLRMKVFDDVLTLDWLLEVVAKGDLQMQKRPKHYAHITADTKHTDPNTDRYGDP